MPPIQRGNYFGEAHQARGGERCGRGGGGGGETLIPLGANLAALKTPETQQKRQGEHSIPPADGTTGFSGGGPGGVLKSSLGH